MEIEALALKEGAEGLSFKVKVQPRASHSKITGTIGDALKLQLTSPPVDGAANTACIAILSDILEVPKGRIVIITGEKSRSKVIQVSGLTKDQFIIQLLKHTGK